MFTNGVSHRQSNLLRLTRTLVFVWVILSLAEASSTYICLRDSANIEGNPFARVLLSHNEALYYGAKLLVTVALGWGFWWLATSTAHLKAVIACLILLIVMFAGVLGNNLLHL